MTLKKVVLHVFHHLKNLANTINRGRLGTPVLSSNCIRNLPHPITCSNTSFFKPSAMVSMKCDASVEYSVTLNVAENIVKVSPGSLFFKCHANPHGFILL